MKLVWLIAALAFACSGSRPAEVAAEPPAASPATPDASRAAPAERTAPAVPSPRVGARTVQELGLLMTRIRAEFPGTPRETAPAEHETTVSRERRVRGGQQASRRAVTRHELSWMVFFVGHTSGEVPAAYTPLSKFIRSHRAELSLKGWECEVFDVRRWRGGGQEILCSVTSLSDWDYSVIATTKAGRLKRGDRLRFVEFTASLPSPQGKLKLAFIEGLQRETRFEVLAAL